MALGWYSAHSVVHAVYILTASGAGENLKQREAFKPVEFPLWNTIEDVAEHVIWGTKPNDHNWSHGEKRLIITNHDHMVTMGLLIMDAASDFTNLHSMLVFTCWTIFVLKILIYI